METNLYIICTHKVHPFSLSLMLQKSIKLKVHTHTPVDTHTPQGGKGGKGTSKAA